MSDKYNPPLLSAIRQLNDTILSLGMEPKNITIKVDSDVYFVLLQESLPFRYGKEEPHPYKMQVMGITIERNH